MVWGFILYLSLLKLTYSLTYLLVGIFEYSIDEPNVLVGFRFYYIFKLGLLHFLSHILTYSFRSWQRSCKKLPSHPCPLI